MLFFMCHFILVMTMFRLTDKFHCPGGCNIHSFSLLWYSYFRFSLEELLFFMHESLFHCQYLVLPAAIYEIKKLESKCEVFMSIM